MKISDPLAIRALAHPLRLDLIELLGGISPATAAKCGRVLGASQASCSFHLRQLAKYGYVEDAGPGRDKRERLWQLADRQLRLDPEADLDPLVVRQFGEVLARREVGRILEFLGRAPQEPPEWQRAAVPKAATIPLTAAEVAEIKEQWSKVIEPYIAKAEANDMQLQPGQSYVRFFLAASPLPDFDLGENDDENTD